MKILYVIDSLNNGGAERQLALLAKCLPQEWDRRVFSLGGGPFVELIQFYGIQIDICMRKTRFDPSPTFVLWRLLAEWKPDVVHSWGWMSSIAAGPACKALGIPFIDGTIRMGDRPPRRLFVQWLGMRCADRIITNSQAGLDAWGIHSSKGRVVYNGFDPERLSLCGKALQMKASPTEVIMTGSMERGVSRRKDYATFFEALRYLLKQDQNEWRFIALGDGPDRQSLLAGASDLVNAGMLKFPEPIMEVLPYVTEAYIGVLMSHPVYHAEGCSNSIMEYMACGLPVICNDTGGNRELVVDGETGFLIPAGDSQALAEKLIYLRNNPREAERFGQAGRRRLLAHFSVETMIEKTIQIYEEVL